MSLNSNVRPTSLYYVFVFSVVLQIIKEVGFEGNFKEFLDMLRTGKRFYYDTKVSFFLLILANIRFACTRIMEPLFSMLRVGFLQTSSKVCNNGIVCKLMYCTGNKKDKN